MSDDSAAFAGPLGPALRDYAAAELDAAIKFLGRRGGQVHEGVHQARKALRRTRATLALGGSALGPGAKLIDRELRHINQQLSRLRDTQALIETLDRLIQRESSIDAVLLLRRARRAAARARAARARRELERDPAFRYKRALLGTLRSALPSLSWSELNDVQVSSAMLHSIGQFAKAGARARSRNRDEDWHRWRRRARRVSQQQRAMGDAGAHLIPAQQPNKALAEWLGEAQDYALLHDHCGRNSPFAKADRRALSALADERRQRLRGRVERAADDAAAPDATPGA